MNKNQRHIVTTIMICHFVAAFAALGMPPYFALILDKSLHSEEVYLAGWFYVVPTFFAAISSPWWGKLADRYGKKPLLLRAQIGLAGSFLLAGFAPNTWVFFVALSLQGLLGGTFAASNAYLATVVNGALLANSLTLMQWSARAALVIAPVGLGLFIMIDSPLELYRYLALLPLIAAVCIVLLPNYSVQPESVPTLQSKSKAPEVTPTELYLLQFAFIFATVITFPYFVPFIQMSTESDMPAVAGLLFGLPHLVYLLIAIPLSRNRWQYEPVRMLSVSYFLFALSLFGQALFPSLFSVMAWRILMGFSMTLGFIGLHVLIVGIVRCDNAGRTFGWFESNSKWGAVAAGLVAGVAVQAIDMKAPFFIGALIMFIAGCHLAGLTLCRERLSDS
ncbi:MFS transporter [Nitrosomonas aestuarii]|uniref:MFS transporter n=1 Tax=Nitrosomonas aestuarii TaxID=52441 RepID=UPI000D2F8007|nr:MFS transporter [Nitrosomonas aestuarii]PTN12399.1 putative MFS family arabinose efflux permease [Nitrosomonas aestuarii]